jgi:beta-1,4-mannosyl-glycoprotein beta-1,4-N-acetylglucosaminyltransferase
MKKLVDAFIFFDELELLLLRLTELESVVDYFVIVESDLTFTGTRKPLYFAECKHLFADYSDRIIHVVQEAEEGADIDPWDREAAQRHAIMHGFAELDLEPTD